MWFVFALLSAVFAALTSILAKIGIAGVNSNLATAIRTMLVAITNLPPRAMMGIESCGMLLSAVYNDINGEEKLHFPMYILIIGLFIEIFYCKFIRKYHAVDFIFRKVFDSETLSL